MNLLAAASVIGMFQHEFMRNAFITTGFVAPACGLVGYFVVLRNEVFAGDAMSHAAFTGSLVALAFGVDQRIGLFGATIALGLGLGYFAKRQQSRDVVIGNFFSWLLGLGVLFLAIFTANHSTGNSAAGPSVLFGSVFGVSHVHANQAIVANGLCIIAIVSIARPLLFSSLDSNVAMARGIPVRGLGLVFLSVVAIVVAEAVQVVGALLVLGLVATPALTIQRVVAKPFTALWASAALCLLESWLGLTASYIWPQLPPSFAVIGIAFAMFAGVATANQIR